MDNQQILERLDDIWTFGHEPTDEEREAARDAIDAVQKQIPHKIIFNSEDDREYEDCICPNCKDILQQRRKGATRIIIYKYKFCHNCGQMLDWSEI